MNFSLEINHKDSLDVISLFPLENAVTFPQELWFQVLSSSLRMKHEVLILEEPLINFPRGIKRDAGRLVTTGVGWPHEVLA